MTITKLAVTELYQLDDKLQATPVFEWYSLYSYICVFRFTANFPSKKL